MAFVNWPSSPSVGQIYEFDGNYWQYKAVGAWRKSILGGQVPITFVKLSDYVEDAQVMPNLVLSPQSTWVVVDYV